MIKLSKIRFATQKTTLWSPSSIALLIANLIPVYGVLFQDWELFPLIFTYWIENVLIGSINILRLLLVYPASLIFWLLKLLIVPFFYIMVFALFNFGYFYVIVAIFEKDKYFQWHEYVLWQDSMLDLIGQIPDGIIHYGILPAVVMFSISHLFSLVYNDYIRGETRNPKWLKLLFRPYARIFIVHTTVIITGIIIAFMEQPFYGLLIVVILKTITDLFVHIREHKQSEPLLDGSERTMS